MLKVFTTLATLALFAQVSGAALANSSVTVRLWDNGETMDMSKDMGMEPGTKMDMSKAPMGIKIQPAVVPQGKVLFKVSNTSKTVIHEMLLAPISSASARCERYAPLL